MITGFLFGANFWISRPIRHVRIPDFSIVFRHIFRKLSLDFRVAPVEAEFVAALEAKDLLNFHQSLRASSGLLRAWIVYFQLSIIMIDEKNHRIL